MARAGLKERIERRLKELERESALVKADIKQLKSALAQKDRLVRLPRLRSQRFESSREAYVSKPSFTAASELSPATKGASKVGALPRVAEPSVEDRLTSADALAKRSGKTRPVERDERFANLFSSSGFFNSAAPHGYDDRVQRNKTIFVVVLLVISLLVVLNLLMY